MNVRRAAFEDTDRILRLYQQLYEAMAEQQPGFYCEADQERAYLHAMMAREDAVILLLETEDTDAETIGFLLMYMEERPHRPFFVEHRYARVVDVLVEKFYRGAGWGGVLLRAAEVWAKQHGAEYLEADVPAGGTAAVSFCRRTGFQDRKHTMILPFD